MFSGMSDHSIDSKGRIVLPAKFREELGESFYITKGFDNPCIQAMSKEQYDLINKRIQELPAKNARALRYRFTACAVEVTPNAQGRVLISPKLREYAGIEDEALVIGMDNVIEIWNKDKFDEFMDTQQDNIEEALSMLRI